MDMDVLFNGSQNSDYWYHSRLYFDLTEKNGDWGLIQWVAFDAIIDILIVAGIAKW